MSEIPSRPRTRRGRRHLAGSIRTGIHTVTIEMRKPSRYVPLMLVVGLGAFAAFGWPLVRGAQVPVVHLDETHLGQLVAVHRGSADRTVLDGFKAVKALMHFEAVPADDTGVQGSFVVLRAERIALPDTLKTALAEGSYATMVAGVSVEVRRHQANLHVLIGTRQWPQVDLSALPGGGS